MSEEHTTFSQAMNAFRRAKERAAVLRHVSVALQKFAPDLHEPEFVLLEDGGAHRRVDMNVIADAVAALEQLVLNADQQAATILSSHVNIHLPTDENDHDVEDDDEFNPSMSATLRVVPNPTLQKKRQPKSETRI